MIPLRFGLVIVALCLSLAPFGIILFTKGLRRGEGPHEAAWRMVRRYYIHVAFFFLVYWQKNAVDTLNDPLRGVFGDFTWLIHAIEGDAVYYVQAAFAHPWLTALLNANYLFVYSFIIYFSVLLFLYDDDRELAGAATLNYAIIYVLAVPFYTFFNVQVTSHYIPAMKSLLYHSSELYLSFFAAADPLDNAFPSLHIGIPFGMWLILHRTMRARGEDPWRGTYRRYLWFLTIELFVFAFSIVYLGIHWFIDIPAGLFIGYLGAAVVEEVHGPVFRALYGGMGAAAHRVRHAVGSRVASR